jgi:RimJ/RimL family protein N-acetyltransferase
MIEPWGPGNLALLEGLLGDPAMMAHLGRPESPERIAKRQADYERVGSLQFRIVDPASGEGAGWVGLWEREWRGEQVYEIGWSVLPAFQGRGLASAATREALAHAHGLRFVHAFPSVDNAPSNAVCRRNGFELLGDLEFEYPKGSWMRCNDWRYRLPA